MCNGFCGNADRKILSEKWAGNLFADKTIVWFHHAGKLSGMFQLELAYLFMVCKICLVWKNTNTCWQYKLIMAFLARTFSDDYHYDQNESFDQQCPISRAT